MGTKNYSSYSDMITFSRASTGTYLDSDGLLKSAATNTPRVEYDYQGNRLGLLVEEARTNYARNSTLFTGSGWSLIDAAVSAGFSAPDGSTDAYKFIPSSSATVNARLFQGTASIPAGSVTGSFYAKAGELNSILLCGYTGSGYQSAYFNLETGQVIGTFGGPDDYSITQITDDGWFRVSVTITNVSNYHINISAGMDDDFFDSTSVQNGANWNSVNGIYIYGAQVEAGTFPTSYIPTSGATATRSLDVTTLPDSSKIWNKGAGTFVATFDYSDPSNVDNNYVMGGTSTARVIYNNVGNNVWQSYDGTASTSFYDVEGDSSVYKLAVSVKEGATSTSAKNGLIVGTRSGSALMSELAASATVSIGGGSSTQMLNGHISSIAYYPRRLTDAQIKALTSPPETPTLSLTFDDSTTSYLETSIHG